MTSKHPQRCETCRHYQTRFEYGNKKICTIIKERAPGSYQIGIPYHIDIVGCASHSSATEPAPERRSIDIAEMLAAVEQARREEREKVLDVIEKWSDNEVYGVDDEGYGATPVVPYLGLEHTIKSLREGAK